MINKLQILWEIIMDYYKLKWPNLKASIRNNIFFIFNQSIILIKKYNYLLLKILCDKHILRYIFYL